MADVAEEIVEAVEEVVEEVEEEEEEEEFVAAAGATEVKLFGKWSFDDIEVRDISLEVSFALSCVELHQAVSLRSRHVVGALQYLPSFVEQ